MSVRFLSILPCLTVLLAASLSAQVTTNGFLNLPQTEAPGTLLSHPVTNGSEPIGRTTSINYMNGWIIVGAEQPGSRPGSDWQMRVYDIEDPETPVRRFPSDFGLVYPNDSWIFGNFGWNAHGSAQYGDLLLPDPIRVTEFGGLVERGGTNGIPQLSQLPIWYTRSSQSGPWNATLLWYNSPDSDITISRTELGPFGFSENRTLGSFDHVGAYGGGDWHPMFFGEFLIMARSGAAANDGVVVYRLNYQNMDDDDPANDAVTPQLIGSLDGGFQGYWPNLFSDGTGLYVVGSTTDILIAADITQAVDPAGDGSVSVTASLTVPGFTNASYPAYQDQFGFIHNRKVDMTAFLAGDANPIVLTLNEQSPPRPQGAPALPGGAIEGVDTSQMSLPLGNLWLTGGYPIPGTNQGLGVWVHQQAPDTTAPYVSYHIPQANRTNYPRHAPLSFLLHEHTRAGGPRNGIDFSVRPVGLGEVLGAAVDGFLIHDFSGNLTFTPTNALEADTTYQVDFLSDPTSEVGFRDAAGNYIEPYAFRFSTGGGIDAPVLPSLTSLTADVYQPATGETVMVTAVATGDGPLEYRFSFEGQWSTWGSDAFASHVYVEEGRPRVLVQVRDGNSQVVNGSVRLLVLDPPPPGPGPTQSSTLAVGDDTSGRRVWAVNPDADTVSVLDAVTGALVAEHPVGVSPRGLARDGNGRYWVSCHRSDEIRVLNDDGAVHATIDLDYGDRPFGVAASPDGQSIFVTMDGAAELHRYSAANPAAAPAVQGTFPTPRAIALSADGQRVLVTRFISPDLEAEIAEFDGLSPSLDFVRMMRLTSANTIDGGDRAAGVPNYLAGIAISPDGTQAAVVSKQDNILRGEGFGVGDLTHETTVRAVISFLDLTTNSEIPHTRRDFDNSDSPSAVTYTPLGDMILVTHQGNNRVVGIDALNLAPLASQVVTGTTLTTPAVITFEVSTGLAPQGVLIDPVSQRLFSQDFMGRSVTVRDAGPLLDENLTSLPLVATADAVGSELLSAEVLQGKRIFYNAADPRMSADSYISCASCHFDGGHDGRVWDFAGRGEGFRRTTDLRGRSGMGHGAVHWSGNFDEIQDFEHDIRGPFGGDGFLPLTPAQFAAQHPSPASGKTGLSSDLDALAAYVASLIPEHTPRSPHRHPDGTYTAAAVAGQAVFAAQNCTSCHAGSSFANDQLMDVGTQSMLSGQRLGSTLPGIDTPTLHGVHASRVYLHHGQASTLEEVFSYAGGTLLLASEAQFLTEINPGAVSVGTEDPSQGGGGFQRGALGGSWVVLGADAGATAAPAVRFASVDGGAGGAAQLAIRYAKQYAGGSAVVRVNGVEQTIALLRQYPDNSWQLSGWRWLTLEVPLNAGTTNTIDFVRDGNNAVLNAMVVSNADDLAQAAPHHLVESLPTNERDDLLAYLRQIDGRDAAGVVLPAPAAPAPEAPSVVALPSNVLVAVGNAVDLTVVVAGTGPFSFQWYRGAVPVGVDSPTLHLPSVGVGDAGTYTVTITNAVGGVTSEAITVTVQPALAVETMDLPTGVIGQAYAASLTASGGVSSQAWSLASGQLPPGLVLSETGDISGVPTMAARAEIVLRVTDDSGEAMQSLMIDTTPPGGFVNDPDLILHYTFDEGSGDRVWDASPSGNLHNTEVPFGHWVGDGRFGGAYGPADSSAGMTPFFPANQDDLNFAPEGDAFTISAWLRTTAAGGYRTVVGKGTEPPGTQVQYRLWTANSPSNVQGITGEGYGPLLATSSPALNDGQWHLLTLVNRLDGATWRTRVYYDDGGEFTEFNTGALPPVEQLMRVGDTSFGGNGWNGQIDDLRIYRRALEPGEVAQLYAPPTSPVAVVSLSEGQEAFSSRPYAEVELTFSRAVQGLGVEDLMIGGTAGHSASHLMTVAEGTHYRLRVAGFAQAGTVTVQLLASAVTALDNDDPNPASNVGTVNYAPNVIDDLAPLSDEFDDPASLSDWQRNYVVEGWTGADKLETWDIDTSRGDHMRLMPYSSSWFQPYTGALAFKEVTGDFVVTMRLHANRRNGLTGRPTSLYSLAGIMVRTPRAFGNAAPVPDPGSATVLPWPPDGSYTTPWTPDSENYIFLSYGYADAGMWGNVPNTWYNEVKTTLNGTSTLYATQTGIPADTDLVTLQVVRVGEAFVVLRRHGESGEWIVENQFTRADMPPTLQVGITTYTDWDSVVAMDPFHHNRTVNAGGNPDLVADADYFRLRRPSPAVTATALQSVAVTGQHGAQVNLADTALAGALGDNVDSVYQSPGEDYTDWLAQHLTPAQLVFPAQTGPTADADENGMPNMMEFVMGGASVEPVQIERDGDTIRLTLTRNALARGATLIIETTNDLTDPLSWTPLATSVNGADPTGTATIQETGTGVRTLEVEVPAGIVPAFYRARVVME